MHALSSLAQLISSVMHSSIPQSSHSMDDSRLTNQEIWWVPKLITNTSKNIHKLPFSQQDLKIFLLIYSSLIFPCCNLNLSNWHELGSKLGLQFINLHIFEPFGITWSLMTWFVQQFLFQDLSIALSKWCFKLSGVVRVVSVNHRLAADPKNAPPTSYTIKVLYHQFRLIFIQVLKDHVFKGG